MAGAKPAESRLSLSRTPSTGGGQAPLPLVKRLDGSTRADPQAMSLQRFARGASIAMRSGCSNISPSHLGLSESENTCLMPERFL